MGCDIHLYTEKRTAPGQPWELFRVYYPCRWCVSGRSSVDVLDDGHCFACKNTKKQHGYDEQNYDVFAQLAGVRNENNIEPIAEPRGWPGDVSPDLRKFARHVTKHGWNKRTHKLCQELYEKHGTTPGEHSHSWLSLRELQYYDRHKVAEHSGIISIEAFRTWDGKEPMTYCRGIGGAHTKLLTTEQARRGDDGTHVAVEWQSTAEEDGGFFWKTFVPLLAEHGDPDNIRIVFGFDS